jgi:hypothetical protein
VKRHDLGWLQNTARTPERAFNFAFNKFRASGVAEKFQAIQRASYGVYRGRPFFRYEPAFLAF